MVDGFSDHSQLHYDLVGRISRTGDYVAVTSFGAMPEVQQMVAMVKKIHERVKGVSSRGITYSANQPDLAAWIYYSLIQSFLVVYRLYGDEPLSNQDADRFVYEHITLAKLMDIDIFIETEEELMQWIQHHNALDQTQSTRDIMFFLRRPPMSLSMRLGYSLLFDAATNSIPERIQQVLSLKATRFGIAKGAFFTKLLRFSMGFSPSLKLAYDRLNKPYPDNRWFIDTI